jgi:hypothetical protein
MAAASDARTAHKQAMDAAQVTQCRARGISEISKFFKLGTDYGDAIDKMTAALCEMRARLFDEERKFPPFDFLAGEAPLFHDPPLFDLAKSNICVLQN